MEELKRPLQLYLSDHDELPNFSSSEWQIIEQVVTNLQPFSQLTIEMSAESCPLSTVIPSVSTLARFFEKTADKEGIKITKQRLLSALLLDPRFKVQLLNDEAHRKTLLLDELFQHHSLHTTTVETVEKARHLVFPLTKYLEKDIAAESANEVELCRRTPLLERSICPLHYWKQEEKFPLLKQLAVKFLCTPASSVYSERLFSEYGSIFEEKRTRLSRGLSWMSLVVELVTGSMQCEAFPRAALYRRSRMPDSLKVLILYGARGY
ncbi:hypothetical protein O3P69_010028 [Scylla paramamosain]|uniref:HAT C-terminal dimerisation domain-containing protein n=1 Tax=Scylla paramamosain TaxID=85552 RepID=A0AAW0SPW8_SCYPA